MSFDFSSPSNSRAPSSELDDDALKFLSAMEAANSGRTIQDSDIDPELLKLSAPFSPPEHIQQSQPSSSTPSNCGPLTDYTHFGSLLKQHYLKDLHPDVEQLFDMACKSTSTDDRIIYVLTMQALMMNQMKVLTDGVAEKSVSFKIEGDLKIIIEGYTWAALNSPTIMSYRSDTLYMAIIAAMRENHRVPREDEIGPYKVFVAFVKTTLTSQRNTLKTKLKNSLTNEDTQNIGNLANELLRLGKRAIPHRQEYWVRLALLRSKAKYLDATDYFQRVDGTLATYVGQASGSTEKFNIAMNQLYREDISLYGDPSTTIHKAVSPDEVAPWIKALDKNLRKVQTIPYGAGKNPGANGKNPAARTLKRKRNDGTAATAGTAEADE